MLELGRTKKKKYGLFIQVVIPIPNPLGKSKDVSAAGNTSDFNAIAFLSLQHYYLLLPTIMHNKYVINAGANLQSSK